MRNWLNNNFPNTSIDRGGLKARPPRSPNLNPLDLFLWSYIKENNYALGVKGRDEPINPILELATDIMGNPK
jgi:hypothetical protein